MLSNWKFHISIFTISCLIVACASQDVREPANLEPLDSIQIFEETLERHRKTFSIPGMSVVVLKDQKIVFSNGFGYADIENQIPATEFTSYNIASLTKPISATLLMGLVEQGQLDLDDKMADKLKDAQFRYRDHKANGYTDLCTKVRKLAWRYGPLLWDYRCHTENITVRHHLSHTAQGQPGERYQYNGFLFTFLSKVIENASNKPFDKSLVDEIIAPLNMTSTIPSITEALRTKTLKQRAKYYRKGAFGGYVPSKYPVKLSSSAGIVSTVLDLAKFDVAMDLDLIISKASKETMYSPTVSTEGNILPYGFGWFVQKLKGTRIIWHYGLAPQAYSSLIVKIPQKELTMILLANSDGASSGFNLAEGDVLSSPFASLFIKHFTDMMAPPRLSSWSKQIKITRRIVMTFMKSDSH